MATSDFLPFGTGAGANVLDQAAYAALAARLAGFSDGIAEAPELNKAWRQSSVIAAVIAQFIADTIGEDVLDDGDLAALQAQYQDALLTASNGRILGVQILTASGTFTPGTYNGVKSTRRYVKMIGGGGAGGSIPATAGSQAAVAGGGQGGAYAEFFDASDLSAGVSVTVGAGGSPGAVGTNSGGSGGASSFGTLCVCPGGSGGPGSGAGATPFIAQTTPSPTLPSGTAALLLAYSGNPASLGVAANLTGVQGGTGGNSPFGSGGAGSSSGSQAGRPGIGHGSGGGGAAAGASSATGNQGGAGSSGYFVVLEFA